MELITNKPVQVMVLEIPDDRGVLRQKPLYARAKPMRLAMEWLDEANVLEAALNGGPSPTPRVRNAAPFVKGEEPGGTFDSTPDALQALAAFVAAYNPEWPVEAILDQATGPMIMNAFYTLKDMNDPLAVVRAKRQKSRDDGLRMFELMAKTNPEAAGKMFDMVSKISPEAAAQLAAQYSEETSSQSAENAICRHGDQPES
jgi:hypothetical protein